MAEVVKLIRTNWKKSLFGAVVVSYGINWGKNQYHIETSMRAFCEEAAKFGDVPENVGKHRRITVILNPAANDRKAKKNFEKYCAPLLHLSGVYVSILETEKEGHAKKIIPNIDPRSDAIVIAGGDGTLSETITGLMRLRGELCKIPIGVLPLGKTNKLASALFDPKDNQGVDQMAEATLAVVRGNTKPLDAIRIEAIDSKDQMPVYGVSGIEWGLWNDMKRKQEKFWYFGPLKRYASLIFPGETKDKKLQASVRYTPPCSGCSLCYSQRPDLVGEVKEVKPQSTRWWARLNMSRKVVDQPKPTIDYSTIINEHCSEVNEKDYFTSDLHLTTSQLLKNAEDKKEPPRLVLSVGPPGRNQGQVLLDGLKYFKGEVEPYETIEAKQVEIRPKITPIEIENDNEEKKRQEDRLSIDNEDYEVRPIRVTVLPNSVNFFC